MKYQIMRFLNRFLLLAILAVYMSSCQAPGKNSPGSEYMPDMAHSIAYEANVYNYYYNNTWGSEDEYYAYAKPRLSVAGTVPRTSTNYTGDNGTIRIPTVGSVPYPYKDTEEERTRAIAEIINNPYPITTAGIAKGKEIYDIFCATCHGEKGDGAGYLLREDGGKYPAQPANFLLEEHVNASNGRYYHAIMHGKNLMGGYSDKMNYEERWQLIHYIRSLQAAELKLAYSETENTLNLVDIPAATLVKKSAEVIISEADASEHTETHHEGDHNH